MKKNKIEEGDNQPIFKGRGTRLHQRLMTLKPGEELHIEKDKDWVGKNPPYYVINRVAKKTGWKIEAGQPIEGGEWIVRRIA